MFRLLKFFIGLVAFETLLATSPTSAQTPNEIELNLPQHNAVCVDGRVSKRKLAGFILGVISTKNADVVAASIRDPDSWRKLLTDNKFCTVPATCDKSPKADECILASKCAAAYSVALQASTRFFVLLNANVNAPRHAYALSRSLADLANDPGAQRDRYFGDESNVNYISCTADNVPKAPPPFDPAKDPVLSNFRIRGLSDELYIGRDQGLFKGTSSATGSFSGDTNAVHTYTSKITGAFGYAFGANSILQAVPYVSIYQALTDTAGKPLVFDPTDNVAAGVLLQSYFNTGDVTNIISVKPQYLLNTSNQAEIASTRAIYTPLWVPGSINAFTHLDFLPFSPWWEFLANLRSDSGSYTNRGNTPAIAAMNENFERVGAQIGFALSTDGITGLPSVTLIVSETYLYGLSGFYRQMNQFQSSLTYNFANNYLGLTASFKKGQDEDTAVKSQIWLIGLSGHY